MRNAASTYIIAAIAVVSIVALGYNFFLVTPSTVGNETVIRECQSKMLSYCTAWSADNYGNSSVAGNGRLGEWEDFAAGCIDAGFKPEPDACNRVLSTRNARM